MENGVTIREVEAIRRELLAEIHRHWEKHEQEHEAEEQKQASRWRWAVTTIMTGLGTLFAIVWAVTHAT